MAIFDVEYTYIDNAELIQKHRPEHRAFLSEQREAGTVLLSGPKTTEPASALIIVRANTTEEAGRILDADPFNDHGIITHRAIAEWNVVIGEL
ncbi:hypothetical protein HMPREF3160_05250 [Arthrobacter sp. HMSC06H05]|uniref:Uncharacterized protein YciI n=1 Tax=Pseudoglutamicibacter albus TaxID=98671 RepID=A0ABU1Z3Y0_9MICC|nr:MULTISPECIES: YciI family protein [Micrococcaceae]MDR7294471.1 uncharacterized protein YciI [Pseudoglutamicibacter albus]OFT42156.1 hypothetical protein HMPREF3160_05250 [Arthrobacter sp. HMSC06H05]